MLPNEVILQSKRKAETGIRDACQEAINEKINIFIQETGCIPSGVSIYFIDVTTTKAKGVVVRDIKLGLSSF